MTDRSMADRVEEMAAASVSSLPACSQWARSQDLSPIGSAGHYQGYLLVELPLPWPADISRAPQLAGVVELADGAGLRVQAMAPAEPGPAGEQPQEPDQARVACSAGGTANRGRRLVYYGTPRPGWAGPLLRRERLAGPGQLAEAVADLLGAGAGPAEGSGTELEVVDVLVCTHGRRDACCGGRGTELVRALAEAGLVGPSARSAAPGGGGPAPGGGRPAPGGGRPAPEVRLWRTSHTGGHRFAPTALVLPSATLWAWADVPLLDRVVRSEGPVSDVMSRYRGCATLGLPAHQAVEKGVLAEVGWPLLSSWRRAVGLEDGWVRLETESAGTWEARAAEGRRVPQPDCRTSPELASKQSVEWVVDALHQVVRA